MQCTDCIHFEVCCYVDPNLPVCDSFKNKYKYMELPCPIGETVFLISEKYDPFDHEIHYGIIETPFKLNFLNWINKSIFLTREEAEKKLEELK